MKWTAKGLQVLQGIGLCLVIPAPHDNDLSKISADVEYTIEVKKKSRKRSLNANAYCWVLCQQIAEKLTVGGSYHSKEDVYRIAIKDSQRATLVPIRDDLVETWCKRWVLNGIGWLSENTGECRNTKGYSLVAMYYGSSTFTVEEMSRLIECLLDECEQLGINTEPQEYINSLIDDWGLKNDR